jgi:hypothetical protein
MLNDNWKLFVWMTPMLGRTELVCGGPQSF